MVIATVVPPEPLENASDLRENLRMRSRVVNARQRGP